MARTGLALLILLALALAGCGEDEQNAPSGGGTPAGGDPSQSELTGPVSFQAGGGEALRLDEMTIQPDGSVRVKTTKGEQTAQLKPDQVAAIAFRLEQAGLDKIPEDSASPEPIPDAVAYRLTYEGRQIDTDQESVPAALEPVLSDMLGLIATYGRR